MVPFQKNGRKPLIIYFKEVENMKKEKILIILITVVTTAIISTIVLVPMISRLMGENREPSSESLEEAKKDGIKLPSFSMNKKTKEETKEKTSEKEKETEKIEKYLETEKESTEEITETSPVPTTESVIETVVETTPIPETTISTSSDTTISPSPSETKSQVFLGEDMEIINSGLERTAQMTSIKEQIKKLMGSEIPQEVAQEVYDLASEGQMLAIANIDTFSYIIGADAEGKFSYMDDEARVLNITCFKQDIEMYRNDYAEFQAYIDWANLFITK